MMRTLIKNGTIVNEGRSFLGDLVVDGEQIAEIYEGKAPRGIYDQVIDASGCFVLPGVYLVLLIIVIQSWLFI